MSVACFRARKRVKAALDLYPKTSLEASALRDVIGIIDEELELEAERQFTRPINPDPVTRMAVENKEDK